MNKLQTQQSKFISNFPGLLSMRAINKIFWDYRFYGNTKAPAEERGLLKFNSVAVLASFPLTDLEIFIKGIKEYRNDERLVPTLKEIKSLAEQSITLYNEAEGGQALTRFMYYEIREGNVYRVPMNDWDRIDEGKVIHINANKRINFTVNRPIKQFFPFIFELESFCGEVNRYITDIIEAYRIKSLENLIKQHKENTEPTASQIALFMGYLDAGGYIDHPLRQDIVNGEFLKKPPYNYQGSPTKIYILSLHVEKLKTERNFKAVIQMLKKYPGALRIAKEDYYRLLQELEESSS